MEFELLFNIVYPLPEVAMRVQFVEVGHCCALEVMKNEKYEMAKNKMGKLCFMIKNLESKSKICLKY